MKRLLKRLFTLPRWVSFPIVVFALVAMVALAYPGGLSAAYADLRDANALNKSIEEYRTTHSRMNGRLTDVRERMDLKEELVTALIHGDVSLAVVADEFVALNEGDEQVLSVQRARYGDLEPREMAARNVLDYVQSRVAIDGGSSVVLSRIEREFQQLFGRPAPKG